MNRRPISVRMSSVCRSVIYISKSGSSYFGSSNLVASIQAVRCAVPQLAAFVKINAQLRSFKGQAAYWRQECKKALLYAFATSQNLTQLKDKVRLADSLLECQHFVKYQDYKHRAKDLASEWAQKKEAKNKKTGKGKGEAAVASQDMAPGRPRKKQLTARGSVARQVAGNDEAAVASQDMAPIEAKEKAGNGKDKAAVATNDMAPHEAKEEAGMGKGKGQAASKKKLPRKAKEESSMGKDEAGNKGKRPGEASAEEDMGKAAGKKVPRKAEHKGSVRLFLQSSERQECPQASRAASYILFEEVNKAMENMWSNVDVD